MESRSEAFSSRWGMLLAMLGMAVGTGNIWRFPRIAASNGGGSFLVAWVVFLLVWSVPLLVLEFGMGKGTRQGAIGAFVKTLGPGFAWMGAWIAFVATAIMFYYSVVMGWTIRFFVGTLTGEVPGPTPSAFWDGFHSTPGAVVTHAVAMGMAIFVVSKGVRGIETAAKVLIPSLVVLVLVLAIRAVTLPGASDGLVFLFTPDLAELLNYEIWIQALTQNAWDTGARLWPRPDLCDLHEGERGHRAERVRHRLRQQLDVAPGGHHGALHRFFGDADGDRDGDAGYVGQRGPDVHLGCLSSSRRFRAGASSRRSSFWPWSSRRGRASSL